MTSKVAIMQPYFLPYIGYFQLINYVDTFVVYDEIQYTKKGWINRNRIWKNGDFDYITLPLKKDSDYLNINQRTLSDDIKRHIEKTFNKIKATYSKAPFYNETIPVISEILSFNDKNLFSFIFNSILLINKHLDIGTTLVSSSNVEKENIKGLKGEKRVLAICNQLKATHYINPIGGVELYAKETFKENGQSLQFLKTDPIFYNQFDMEFAPALSIVDVLMFNGKEQSKALLSLFSLI